MNNLLDAIRLADESFIFDNSHSQPKLFATIIDGKLTILDDMVPLWFKTYVLNRL